MITAAGRPALFLDKDGTLLEDLPYNVDPAAMKLMPGAGPALRRLRKAGFSLIVVTNQSGVARGLFPPSALRAVQWRLEELLAQFDVHLDGFHACPHHPAGIVAPFARECECRKPEPGLLLAAAEEGIDLTASWMVGDILDDVEAGSRAGCRTVLLDDPACGIGGETEWLPGECRTPTLIAGSLTEAADAILRTIEERTPEERKEERCDAIYSN